MTHTDWTSEHKIYGDIRVMLSWHMICAIYKLCILCDMCKVWLCVIIINFYSGNTYTGLLCVLANYLAIVKV